MNFRHLIIRILFLFVFTSLLFARDKTDVLVMKNGDRMTCEIKGLDSGVLYASFDYIDGTASVDWSKIARLESKQLFVVKTEDGSIYTGTLRTPETPGERPMKISVLEDSKELAVVERSQVVQMVATSDKFWERFNGEIGFGTIYSKGNQSSQYSLNSAVAYVRERWDARAAYNSSLSSSTGVSASTRNSLSVIAIRLLPAKNWFYSGLGGVLESSEQGIALQGTVGGGVGRYLKNTNRATVMALGGVAWQGTTYKASAAAKDQNLVTALFYGEAQFFKFSKTSLDFNASVLPALSDPGRVRSTANATYYVKIFGDLKWNASFYGNWDNRPPPGFSGSDYGTSSSLSWTFGLK